MAVGACLHSVSIVFCSIHDFAALKAANGTAAALAMMMFCEQVQRLLRKHSGYLCAVCWICLQSAYLRYSMHFVSSLTVHGPEMLSPCHIALHHDTQPS